ncbi:MAG TPA: Ig-like domain-containing protein [Nitrospirota bacterium]|nr:Ig-like domain-containing protein [Nitrospirota bacterium]
MDDNDYSRREFLRAFAALSAAPLLASMLSGCGRENRGSPAMYGPAPAAVTVNGMVFLDAQSNQVNLSGAENVPVNASFVIQFSGLINVASVAAATTFLDSNNNHVAFLASSDQNAPYSMDVTITPTAALAQNTNYTVSVGDTATDYYGENLVLTANASASFRTAA